MKTTDVLIIGGGVIGLACARQLALRGLNVTVLEKGKPGQEASWAAAGMLAPQCEIKSYPPFFALCKSSLELYPTFSEQLREESGVDIGYRTEGTLCPAFEKKELKALEEEYARQTAEGLTVEWLSAFEARKLEPALSPNILAALYIPTDHQVDNRQLVKALVAAVGWAGVEVMEDTLALRIQTEGNRVIGVETDKELIGSSIVINAAGCWAKFIQGLDDSLALCVRPVKGQMLALEMGTSPLFRHVIYSHRSYLVPRSDGRLLVGATVEEAGFNKDVTAQGIYTLLKGALEVAPLLRNYPLSSTWAGLRPATTDLLPILGPTELEGCILATGHFRNGILLTPLTAELIANTIFTGEIAPVMKPFTLERFY